MSLTINLSREREVAIAEKARSDHLPTEEYLAQILEHAFRQHHQRAAATLAETIGQLSGAVPTSTSVAEM